MREGIREGDIPGVQLRWRGDLPVGVEAAWEWLTRPDRLEQWLCDRATVEPEGEGSLLLESEAGGGRMRRERLTPLESRPPRRWVAAFMRLEEDWRVSTRLTFELAARPRGAEISVLQEGFEHLSLSTCLTVWEEYRRRWRAAFERLTEISATDESVTPF